MSFWMGCLSVVIAYIIGSISTSTLVVRLVSGRDIREEGSGNAGATNTMRAIGTKWGVVVLLADALKGMIALWIALALTRGSVIAAAVSAIAVVVGHNWPIFFGFRGGKGIATTIGVLLWLAPIPTVIAGVICLIAIALTRYVSLGSLILTVLVPIIVAVWFMHTAVLVASIVLALLSIYRHRSNIARLVRGQERRIFDKSGESL
ncbi:glycerol-3-phosphate acyltransferase 2 [Alicyclobacillus hesperidum]|uniref:Glycerol-3-phosphate acyltransferase n=1 Tax=Alicyclobacillus hesperidum TaxID=89784 RepID=A0A1H2XV30_9BACL|nr:glycerol-3-phosphate 1-O-acyltransferase PlsY [Alicyclobacillus hesperidum]GLV12629.1 glycerol-3-phosphate acyltransferase 2 [Alicyclobacillus hesperidum]SDW96169.1 glycerol-3-phosphate acyltransferase PlsY [Alicyclobacillus hesperidum]